MKIEWNSEYAERSSSARLERFLCSAGSNIHGSIYKIKVNKKTYYRLEITNFDKDKTNNYMFSSITLAKEYFENILNNA